MKTLPAVFCTSITAVCNGLKEINTLNSPMARVKTFCCPLHSTCGLKGAFGAEYVTNRSNPSATSVRWSSALRLVEAITHLENYRRNSLLEAQ